MASPQYEAVFLYDAVTGAPKAGVATLAFDSYKDDLGNNLAQPAIVELPGGDGCYGFIPVFASPNRGIRYVLNANDVTVAPQRAARYMRPEDYNLDNLVSTPYIQFYANGDTVNPVLITVSSPRHTQVRVTFSEPVVMTTDANGALRLSNYTIPGLTLSAVTQVTPSQVLITTSPQTANQLYSLTVQNIEDLVGNPIA